MAEELKDVETPESSPENSFDTSEPQKTPAGAWAVMLSVFLAGIVMAFAQYKVNGVLDPVLLDAANPSNPINPPSIAGDLGLEHATAGWLASIFTLVGIFLAFPAVAIIKKWGIKTGGLVALGFAIFGSVIGLFADNATAIIVARVIEGFGLGFIGVIAPTAIAMWFPIPKRGAPMGIWSSWQMWGIGASFLFGIPITEGLGNAFGYDWKNLWIVGPILLIIGIIVYALVVKVPPKDQNYADLNDESDGKVSIFAAVKYPNAWIMAFAGLTFGLANNTVITWISPFWQISGTADAAMANSMTGVMFILDCFLCIVFGFIINAIHKRRRFQVAVAFFWALVYFLIFQMAGPGWGWTLVIIYAITESAYCSCMWTICPQAVPDPRAGSSMVAFFTIGIDIGMMSGGPIGGWILDMTRPAGFLPGQYTQEQFVYLSILVLVFQLIAAICYAKLKMYNEKGEIVKI